MSSSYGDTVEDISPEMEATFRAVRRLINADLSEKRTVFEHERERLLMPVAVVRMYDGFLIRRHVESL